MIIRTILKFRFPLEVQILEVAITDVFYEFVKTSLIFCLMCYYMTTWTVAKWKKNLSLVQSMFMMFSR